MTTDGWATQPTKSKEYLSRILFGWLFFIIIFFVLAALNVKHILNDDTLPRSLALSLCSLELLLGLGLLLVLALFCQVLRRLLIGRPRSLRFLRWIGMLGMVVIVFWYLCDWYAFATIGQFTGLEGIDFFMGDPFQTLQHAAEFDGPRILVFWLLELLILWAVWLFLGLLWRYVLGLSFRRVVIVFIVGLLVVGVSALSRSFLRASFEASLAKNGTKVSYEQYLKDAVAERSGPLLRVVADLRLWLFEKDQSSTLAQVPFYSPPLLSWEDYLKGVGDFKHYNVITVLVESLRSDQLTFYGSPRLVLPNVEAVAKEGVVFLDHYSEASHSDYSDMCFLSSHYPLRSRFRHRYPEHPLYPRVLLHDVLKQVGYKTAIISSQNEYWGNMYYYLQTGNVDYFLHSETFEGPTYVPREDTVFAEFIKGSKRAGKIDDRFTVSKAIEWIDAVSPQPFVFYMNLQNSHIPYEIPADYQRKFSKAQQDFTIYFGNFPLDKVSVVKDIYADSLGYVDQQLGRLVQHLKDRQLWDKTILVISGDTGQAFFEHGFAGHGSKLYEELLRTPLIIHAPNLAPALSKTPAEHIDVPPSVLHLLGLPVHPSFQGINLFSDRDESQRPRFMVVQTPLAYQYAVVKNSMKLVFDQREAAFKLFDLDKDPQEKMDLSESQPLIVQELSPLLLSWRKAQIEYYERPEEYLKSYPPRLK